MSPVPKKTTSVETRNVPPTKSSWVLLYQIPLLLTCQQDVIGLKLKFLRSGNITWIVPYVLSSQSIAIYIRSHFLWDVIEPNLHVPFDKKYSQPRPNPLRSSFILSTDRKLVSKGSPTYFRNIYVSRGIWLQKSVLKVHQTEQPISNLKNTVFEGWFTPKIYR